MGHICVNVNKMPSVQSGIILSKWPDDTYEKAQQKGNKQMEDAIQTIYLVKRPKTLIVVAFAISEMILKHIFICILLNFGYFTHITHICIWDSHNLTHTGLDLSRVVPLA